MVALIGHIYEPLFTCSSSWSSDYAADFYQFFMELHYTYDNNFGWHCEWPYTQCRPSLVCSISEVIRARLYWIGLSSNTATSQMTLQHPFPVFSCYSWANDPISFHSLIMSFHLFLCLPLLVFLFTVPDGAMACCAYSWCGWGLYGYFFSRLSIYILFFLPLSGRRSDIGWILSQRAVKLETTNLSTVHCRIFFVKS